MTTPRMARVTRGPDSLQDGVAGLIYRDLWGDSRHIGIFEHPGETVHDAMARVSERLIERAGLRPGLRVLDVACGSGALARHLAAVHACRVNAIDTSDMALAWGEALARAAGLADRIDFSWGDLHRLPFENCTFDVYWAQECFLHASSKHMALEEASRVLKPGGRLVLTDLVVRRETTPEERAAIADRVAWPEMWDQEDYRLVLGEAGFVIECEDDWSDCIAPTYDRLVGDLERRRREFEARIGRDAVDHAAATLRFWSEAAENDRIGWIHVQARRL